MLMTNCATAGPCAGYPATYPPAANPFGNGYPPGPAPWQQRLAAAALELGETLLPAMASPGMFAGATLAGSLVQAQGPQGQPCAGGGLGGLLRAAWQLFSQLGSLITGHLGQPQGNPCGGCGGGPAVGYGGFGPSPTPGMGPGGGIPGATGLPGSPYRPPLGVTTLPNPMPGLSPILSPFQDQGLVHVNLDIPANQAVPTQNTHDVNYWLQSQGPLPPPLALPGTGWDRMVDATARGPRPAFNGMF